jgi:hypothetical protein
LALPFAGFDALEIQGKSEEDESIIDGEKGTVSVETAPLEETNTHLRGAAHPNAPEDTDISRQRSPRSRRVKGAEHSTGAA